MTILPLVLALAGAASAAGTKPAAPTPPAASPASEPVIYMDEKRAQEIQRKLDSMEAALHPLPPPPPAYDFDPPPADPSVEWKRDPKRIAHNISEIARFLSESRDYQARMAALPASKWTDEDRRLFDGNAGEEKTARELLIQEVDWLLR